jgi:hypothetical protein
MTNIVNFYEVTIRVIVRGESVSGAADTAQRTAEQAFEPHRSKGADFGRATTRIINIRDISDEVRGG